MKYSQTAGIIAVFIMAALCWAPWSYVPDGNLTFTGMHAGDNYGRPGILHLFFGAVLIIFFLIPKIWAKRTNIFIAAINLAWGIKNLILMGSCYMGVCPEKKPSIYALVAICALIQAATLFPGIKLPEEK